MLRAGQLRSALDTFKSAILMLNQIFPLSERRACNKNLEQVDLVSTFVLESQLLVQNAQRQLALIPAAVLHQKSSLASESFCAEPILLSESDSPCWCETRLSLIDTASAAIVYNMALTYHIVGTAPALQKALSLMGMAHDLVASHIDDDDPTPLQTAVVAACLNNCGVIYHALGDYQNSRQCLDALSSYILCSPSLPLPPILIGKQNDKAAVMEHQRLLLNAMFLTPPTVAGAA